MNTLILIKPDALKRALVGTIVSRFEQAGFVILEIGMFHHTDLLVEHYAEHRDKEYFEDLITSMNQGPLIAMIVQYLSTPALSVGKARELIGPYKNRVKGTIRGDYAINDRENSVHASDSQEAAIREMSVWFPFFIEE